MPEQSYKYLIYLHLLKPQAAAGIIKKADRDADKGRKNLETITRKGSHRSQIRRSAFLSAVLIGDLSGRGSGRGVVGVEHTGSEGRSYG